MEYNSDLILQLVYAEIKLSTDKLEDTQNKDYTVSMTHKLCLITKYDSFVRLNLNF